MTRKLGLRGRYSTHLLKQLNMLTKTDAKAVDKFWENDQRP